MGSLCTIFGHRATGRPAAWPEDAPESMPPFVATAITYAMGATVGPALSLHRLVGCAVNCTENELFFLALGAALSAYGTVPANGADLVKVYVYSRVVHNVTFVFSFPQPCRAAAWLAGIAPMMALAGAALGY